MKDKKYSTVEMPAPKESTIYSKVICRPACDSFGVEPGNERSIFYKHAIPAGGVSKIWVLFFKNTFNNLNNSGVNVPLGTTCW